MIYIVYRYEPMYSNSIQVDCYFDTLVEAQKFCIEMNKKYSSRGYYYKPVLKGKDNDKNSKYDLFDL